MVYHNGFLRNSSNFCDMYCRRHTHTHCANTSHQRQGLQCVGSHQRGDPMVDRHTRPQEEDTNRTDERVHIAGSREAIPGGEGPHSGA